MRGFVVVRTYDSRQSCLLWSAEQGDQIKNVRVAEATTAVADDKGRTWQLLSVSYCYFFLFLLFACCCFLGYWRLVVLTTELSRQVLSRCWFPLLLCLFLWMNRLISVVILVERGTGRNEHGVVVEWISACVWCLVSACSSSWYVLYLFVRFSFGLLSTCVTTGWIFEISLCENSINQSINTHYVSMNARIPTNLTSLE